MTTLLNGISFVTQNYQAIVSATVALLTGVIAVAMLIPGAEPEKSLQKIVDFVSKFSKK